VRVSKCVLDASAALALLDNEPGADAVAAVLMDSVIGTVNLAEVHSKLVERGQAGREALAEIVFAMREVVAFSQEHALLTGSLREATRQYGLSLGDRACLALGIALKAPVYTTEKLWAKLDLPCAVHVIR
jgi:ribonuclease VapC